MRRTFTVVLVAGMLAMMMQTPALAGWRYKSCRYESLDGRPGFTTTEVQKTIGCVADRLGVSRYYADLIAQHESGFNEFARNGSSGACGLYQFYPCSKFSTLVSNVPSWWKVKSGAPWYSARAHVLAALYLAKSGGWGPWCSFTTYC